MRRKNSSCLRRKWKSSCPNHRRPTEFQSLRSGRSSLYPNLRRRRQGRKTGLYLVDLCKGRPEQSEIARCLTARYGQTALSNRPRERSGVLTVNGKEKRIHRLMPRECLRLQGFTEDQIDRLLAITSDSQAYKQAGNSVTVNVIEAIGHRIRAADEGLRKGDSAA